ncbi:MAG TPA: TolC family protein, partial [Flavobacteriaceae bacterium]|nr:TolC family protein [Flavobacteriaceae bacterium]
QFLYEAQEAVEKGISAYEEVLRNTENMKNQGYAKESDVLLVKVGLSEVENKLIEINNNISNLSDYLSWLMGVENEVVYTPTRELSLLLDPVQHADFSEARADILAMKSGIEAQNKMLSTSKNGLLPRLNAFGEFYYQDENILGFGANAYMAGVSLSWNIFDGNKTLNSVKRNRIKRDKSQSEMKLHIEKSKLELQKTQRELTAQEAKINLTQTAKDQASEALRILENRYAEGLEKTSDLLVAQAKELEKQVDYLEQIKDYNLLVIQIKFLTNNNN